MDNNKLNFITTYLRHRSVYTAYCIAYNVEDQRQYETIMSAGQQLMDDPEVGGLIRSVLEHVHYEVEQEIRAQQKTELLTIQRKRELLANIATGEMYAVQNYKGKDCNQCTQMVQPTINQMLKAIDLDNKMAGHYSVHKRQAQLHNETASSQPIEKTSISQQLSEAVSLRPLNKPSISQQNATNTLDVPPFREDRRDFPELQNNKSATNHNKIEEAPLLTNKGTLDCDFRHGPTGEVEHSRKTGNGNNSQQLSEAVSLQPLNETSISQQKSPLPGRGLGEASLTSHTVDNKVKAHLALLGTNILYGAGYSVPKLIMPRLIEPLGFIFIRAGTTALLFWLTWFLGNKYRATISKKDWGVLVLGGLFGIAINQMLFFMGLNLTLPIHASLVVMSTPLLITLVALFVLRERISRNKILGLLLGIAGAVLLMSAGKELSATGTNTALGDLFVFLNAASYAVYLVIIKPVMRRYRPIVVIRWVFLFGFAFIIPFGWQQFTAIQWQLFTLPDFGAIVFIVVFVTFLTYLWNIYGLSHLSVSTAGAYMYLQPFFAGTISVIFMGEEVTAAKIFAAILIFAGVYLVNFAAGKKELKQQEYVKEK